MGPRRGLKGPGEPPTARAVAKTRRAVLGAARTPGPWVFWGRAALLADSESPPQKNESNRA
jgi:hypothetical protein